MSSNIGSVLGLDVGFPGPYPIVTTGSIPPPPFRHSTDYNKPIFVTESLSRNASLNFNPEECDLATGPGTTNRAKISGSEIPLNSLPQEPGEFFEDPLSLVGEELHHHEGYDDEDEITRKNTDPVLINHNRNPTTPTTGLTSSRTLPSSRASSNLVTPSPAHGTSLPDNNGKKWRRSNQVDSRISSPSRYRIKDLDGLAEQHSPIFQDSSTLPQFPIKWPADIPHHGSPNATEQVLTSSHWDTAVESSSRNSLPLKLSRLTIKNPPSHDTPVEDAPILLSAASPVPNHFNSPEYSSIPISDPEPEPSLYSASLRDSFLASENPQAFKAGISEKRITDKYATSLYKQPRQDSKDAPEPRPSNSKCPRSGKRGDDSKGKLLYSKGMSSNTAQATYTKHERVSRLRTPHPTDFADFSSDMDPSLFFQLDPVPKRNAARLSEARLNRITAPSPPLDQVQQSEEVGLTITEWGGSATPSKRIRKSSDDEIFCMSRPSKQPRSEEEDVPGPSSSRPPAKSTLLGLKNEDVTERESPKRRRIATQRTKPTTDDDDSDDPSDSESAAESEAAIQVSARSAKSNAPRRHRAVKGSNHICTWKGCCGTFTRASDLQRHVQTVHQVKKLPCPNCYATFVRKDALDRHKKKTCGKK